MANGKAIQPADSRITGTVNEVLKEVRNLQGRLFSEEIN